MKNSTHQALVIFAFLSLVLSWVFIILHLATASDGARLFRGNNVFSTQGVVLSPFTRGSTLIQDGDVLIAVQGNSIKDRAKAFFKPVPTSADWKTGNSFEYTILRNNQAITINIQLDKLPLVTILADSWGLLLFIVISQIIAAFVYFQKRSDPAAQAFLIWAFSGSHIYSWTFFLQTSDLLGGTGFWLFRVAATGLWLVFWIAAIHLLVIFPRPLINPRHLSKTLLPLYASPFIVFGAYVGIAWFRSAEILTWWNSWSEGEFFVAAVFTLPAVVLMFIQFRTVRSEAEKTKVRLLVFGGLISTCLGMILYFLPGIFLNRTFLNSNGLGLINSPFIIGISIAIWRYRLFDIDLIIRKTLVYSILTSLLGLMYFIGVAITQGILTANDGELITDGRQPPAFVIVVVTLAIALVFNPLRRRIQDTIDRRFYRQKYDAEKALAAFAQITRGQTDLESLSNNIIGLVQTTLQPDHTSLWIEKR